MYVRQRDKGEEAGREKKLDSGPHQQAHIVVIVDAAEVRTYPKDDRFAMRETASAAEEHKHIGHENGSHAMNRDEPRSSESPQPP